jgi:hypothetical protein
MDVRKCTYVCMSICMSIGVETMGCLNIDGGRWNEKVVGEVKTRADDVMCYHEHTLFSYIDIDLPFPPIHFQYKAQQNAYQLHSFILSKRTPSRTTSRRLRFIRVSEMACYVVRQIDRYIARY